MQGTTYTTPGRGNSGEFGTEDSAKRKIDSAGKLIEQRARPDLKAKDYVDPDRKPTFIQMPPQG